MKDELEGYLAHLLSASDDLGFEAAIVGVMKEYRLENLTGEVEVGVVDDRLLKIWPKHVRTKVLLECSLEDGKVCLYRLRTNDVTHKYRGRQISVGWIIKLMKSCSALAAKYTEEAVRKLEVKRANEEMWASRPPPTRIKCDKCVGKGSWWPIPGPGAGSSTEHCDACGGWGYIDQP